MLQIEDLNPLIVNLSPYSVTKNEDLKEKLRSQGIEVSDFTLGDPLEPTPSFIRKALCDGVSEISQYPMNAGSLALRNACASYIKRRTGVEINPQTEILSSNGSKEAIFHIPQILFNSQSARRTVIFPEPGYPVYKSGTILAGGIPYESPLNFANKFIFEPDDIPAEMLSQISAVWVSYPHNPTGACISRVQMEKIYNWAIANDILLLSDECYLDMYYENSEVPHSFLEIAAKNQFKNLLCFFSLSKRSGMTGYRSGFIAGQKELIALYSKYRLNVGLGTPDFVQKAAIAAWSDDEHVVERNKVFAQKRKIADDFLIKNKIKVLPCHATFYVWGEVPASYKTGREFADELVAKTGIMLTAGDAFGPSCARNFRMALVPTVEKMTESFSVWQKQIDNGNFKL